MRFLNHKLIILTIIFCVGVVFGFHIDIQHKAYVLLGTSLLFLSSYFVLEKRLKFSALFFALAILMSFLIGFTRAKLELPKYQKGHYLTSETPFDTLITFKAKVSEVLKSNAYNNKYYVQIAQLNSQESQGKILLKIEKNALSQTLKVGSLIGGVGQFTNFKSPQNPQQFDYKKYMLHQSVYAQINTTEKDIFLHKIEPSLKSYAEQARLKIEENLKQAGFSKDHLGLIEALLLGHRDKISNDTLADFQNAGVIHILAVSGLHVGIILIFLHWITFGLTFGRIGRQVRPMLVIIGLWAFAFLAGLSPSVIRATLMFSVLSLTFFLQRRTSTINILFIALLIMLIFNPHYIFQAGFQLSFLAVTGIIILHPRLQKLYQPRYVIDRIIWNVLSVSIIAQISVLPLILYYFNQISGLFWLANLLIIPFLGLILGIGILCILLSLINALFQPLVQLYSFVLDGLLAIIKWVSLHEDFIFKNIYFNEPMLGGSLLLLLTVFMWNRKVKKRSYLIINSALVIFGLLILSENNTHTKQKEILILKAYKSSIIAKINGSKMTIYRDSSAKSQQEIYTIESLAQLKGIQHQKEEPLLNAYVVKPDQRLLIIDSLSAFEKEENYDYIILRNSPQLNLERFLSERKPQIVIADASNYKDYVNRWKSTCEKFNIDFHSIYQDGTFELSSLKK